MRHGRVAQRGGEIEADMVIEAKREDVIRKIVNACAEFQKHSHYVEVDVNHSVKMYKSLIDSGACALFGVLEKNEFVGGLGCIKSPDFHCGKMTATELFWFVKPEHRGRGIELLDAFERWAEINKCSRLIMVYMEDSMPKVLARFYRMKGYTPLERHFVKEL